MMTRILKRFAILWLLVAIMAPVILFINPIREAAVDDDWFYALTAKHLVETGSYQLSQWSDPNMPFQAYWGALFAWLFGYSFTSLRISTLVLTFLGLVAFYYLARENRFNRGPAIVLVLCLFSSPLVMRYTFSFNSDVPFLMCVVIALALYLRAIRLESYSLMFLGSCAAAAAVLTRQFGMALPASLSLLWILTERRRTRARLFLAGFLLPALASVWQLLASSYLTPTWSNRNTTYRQMLYFADVPNLLGNMVWRPAPALHYLVLFTVPLALVVLLSFLQETKEARTERNTRFFRGRHSEFILVAASVYIIFGIVYGRLVSGVGALMPYLSWDETLLGFGRLQRAGLTLFTSIGAVLYIYFIAQRYVVRQNWRAVPAHERLLDLFTLLFFIEHLLFQKFGDRYLLALLPFVLITVGHRAQALLSRYQIAVSAVCLLMLLTTAMWTRGLLEYAEAGWKAGEWVRATGVERNRIFGTYEWNSYRGAADDYIAEVGSTLLKDNSDYWYRWNPERQKRAEFLITSTPNVGGKIIYEIPYRDTLFRQKRMYVVSRQDKGTQGE